MPSLKKTRSGAHSSQHRTATKRVCSKCGTRHTASKCQLADTAGQRSDSTPAVQSNHQPAAELSIREDEILTDLSSRSTSSPIQGNINTSISTCNRFTAPANTTMSVKQDNIIQDLIHCLNELLNQVGRALGATISVGYMSNGRKRPVLQALFTNELIMITYPILSGQRVSHRCRDGKRSHNSKEHVKIYSCPAARHL